MEKRNIGSAIISLDQISSTNVYANELIEEGKLGSGTVILARNQTAGKGQQGNKWESQAGKNLTFSTILQHEDFPANDQFMLSKAISLGLIDYLKQYANEFRIKWPNDIFFKNRKIAGILIENSVQGAFLSESVVGIGLNINQKFFSNETRNPISLSNIVERDFAISEELEKLLPFLDKRYQQLRNNSHEELDSDYLKVMYRIGEWKEYRIDDEVLIGKILGVTPFGLLLVEMKDGSQLSFAHKQIEYVI